MVLRQAAAMRLIIVTSTLYFVFFGAKSTRRNRAVVNTTHAVRMALDIKEGFVTNGVHPKEDEEPFWVAVVPHARLGNQMYQHASSLGAMLSVNDRPARLCYHTRIDSDQYTDRVDRIKGYFEGPFTGKCPSDVEFANTPRYLRYEEEGPGIFTPLNLTNAQFEGKAGIVFIRAYLQSFKYFEHIFPLVRKMFIAKPETRRGAQDHLKRVVEKAAPNGAKRVVGIHVRRGDQVLDDTTHHSPLRFPPDTFFEAAMSHFKEKYGTENVVFVVASDDLDWSRRQKVFQRQYVGFSVFSEHIQDKDLSSVLEMTLLADCDDIITSIGSFGIWGGFLSGGEVVFYRDVFNPSVRGQYRLEDVFPPNWLSIGDDDLEKYTVGTLKEAQRKT